MKRLYKSRNERVVFGVAGGIAEYFEIDPTLVRLAWVLVALSGVGVLAYIVAALIIPDAPYSTGPKTSTAPTPHDAPGQQAQGSEAALEGQETSPPEAGVPELPTEGGLEEPRPKGIAADSRTFGMILVVIGSILMVRRIVPHYVLNNFWPIALILLGGYLVSQAARGGR